MRTWALLVYMAGDAGAYFRGPIGDRPILSDLSRPLQADLAKIAAAGSTAAVGVCVQFDSLRDGQAFRWVVPPAGRAAESEPRGIGSVNTGEPGSLTDFMAWAGQQCPAARYAVIIWGHGSGWSEEQIYARYPPASAATRDASAAKDGMLSRGIFASTAGKLLAVQDPTTRALGYDDSSRDFLDNQELRRALSAGAAALGRPAIDVLGLDACLMTMLEVAHEVRKQARYLVGSETVLPQEFWPWTTLLTELQAQPGLGAQEVARLMGGHLPGDDSTRGLIDVCQSVLDLGRAEGVTAAVDAWSRAALDALKADWRLQGAFEKGLADDGAFRMAIPRGPATDYVDIYDLLRVLIETWEVSDVESFLVAGEDGGSGEKAAFRRSTHRLLAAIRPEAAGSMVIGRKIDGFRRRPAPGGLSIYLPLLGASGKPRRELSPQYGNLAFSDSAWPELVCRLFGLELPKAFIETRGRRAAQGAETQE